MGNCTLTETYKCHECQMHGCDGHEVTLNFQTTSEAYTFEVAGQTVQLVESDIRAMLSLLSQLSIFRVDAIDPLVALKSLPWVSS